MIEAPSPLTRSGEQERKASGFPHPIASLVLLIGLIVAALLLLRVYRERQSLLRQQDAQLTAWERPFEAGTWTRFHQWYDGIPKLGQTMADFTLMDDRGRSVRLSDVARGSRLVVVSFIDTRGDDSKRQLVELQAAMRRLGYKGLRVVGIASNPAPELRRAADDLLIEYPLLLDPHKDVFKLYRSTGTPFAIAMNPQREVQFVQARRRSVTGVNGLCKYAEQELTGSVSHPLYESPESLIGQSAPSFRIRDLDEKVWESSAHRSGPTDLLFMLSGCRSCEDVVKNLLKKSGPETVVILSGEVSDKAHNLARLWMGGVAYPQRPVRFVADFSNEVSQEFRVNDYPSLIRLDTEGKIQRCYTGEEGLKELGLLSGMP
jgi:peroxiredoxin